MNGLHSEPARVSFAIVQGSCLSPVLFTMLIDKLLRCIHNPTAAFTDDVKFEADGTVNGEVSG